MSQEFKTGLFECMMNTQICLDGCLCPCVQVGRQCEAVENNQVDTGNLTNCCLGAFCYCFAICNVRRKVVEKYDIDEGSIGSCLKSLLCGCCSLTQTHRELTLRKVWPGGYFVKEPMQMK